VVVGIGINVAWPGPDEAGGTCVDDAGGTAQPVDKGALLDLLLEGLARRRPLLDEETGRRTLADEVRRRCSTLGQRVRVSLPDEELTGTASAIDDAGHLVVETASGRREVGAGDVVHLRPE
jgi:BirA family biotin operon repressor/biotin-[acetyl-CoA-carboxylase] ligase